MAKKEFYIGWMKLAPDQVAVFIKKYLFILLPAVAGLAALLATGQKRFGTGNYEFGELTKLKGTYFNQPVPLLRVADGTTSAGEKQWMNIPLLGYGKMGAGGIIAELEKQRNISLNGLELTLQGTLLYNDGKTFLEINTTDSPLVALSGTTATDLRVREKKELGTRTLNGEIVDPKCFFGVMKPGEGKPHSDCAIRCILGGIAPAFVVRDSSGKANYFLIAGKGGGNISEKIKPFVGRPVSLTAKLVQYDDWIVMYPVDEAPVQPLSYLQEKFGREVIACSAH